MLLRKNKLNGVSLIELLVYMAILGLVSTGLFSIIHLIQKMHTDNLKQQEAYATFNLALLKLDQFVSNSDKGTLNTSVTCIEKDEGDNNNSSYHSFYFIQNQTNDYSLCESYESNTPLCNSINILKCNNSNEKVIAKSLLNPSIQLSAKNSYDEVIFSLNSANDDLHIEFLSLTNQKQ
jgi:type II secretory pathway pseudopilin PulG